jgi:hypothetical protein
MSRENVLHQWINDGGNYRPVMGGIAAKVAAGVYEFDRGTGVLFLKPAEIVTDDLIELPDPTCAQVLAGIEKFWTMESRYRDHGLLYKRSIGLHGPPGGGKTATVIMLGRRLVALDGLVILFNGYTDNGLAMLRQVEPQRRIVCIMEELDDLVETCEDEILSLLDGETQVDGIVYLATTNHYEKLPATLVNRPSRFDEWHFVGTPSAQSRAVYLRKVTTMPAKQLGKWVRDTDGFSVAHLKELVAAVLCLDCSYESVLERLKKMIAGDAKK